MTDHDRVLAAQMQLAEQALERQRVLGDPLGHVDALAADLVAAGEGEFAIGRAPAAGAPSGPLTALREELETLKLAACDTRYSSAALGMRIRNLWHVYEAGINALAESHSPAESDERSADYWKRAYENCGAQASALIQHLRAERDAALALVEEMRASLDNSQSLLVMILQLGDAFEGSPKHRASGITAVEWDDEHLTKLLTEQITENRSALPSTERRGD